MICGTAHRQVTFIPVEKLSHPHVKAADYREIIYKKMLILSDDMEATRYSVSSSIYDTCLRLINASAIRASKKKVAD